MNNSLPVTAVAVSSEEPRKIKCVVWDLDNTVWDGILLESDRVVLKDGVADVIKELDARGILHSIASRNDPERALAKLREFGLADYFLYPQIGWNAKSASIKKIAEAINIGISTFAFIDDQPFELEEVKFSHPEVLCIPADHAPQIPDLPEMQPVFITEDSKLRRLMYLNDQLRNKAEEQFEGAAEEFLATLGMKFTIARAQEEDLRRAEELTVRTNQLNTTGYTYSFEELRGFSQSDSHWLLISSLDDKFGTYGKIGLALVETQADVWAIKLLLMSCRVMSRGVGTIMLNFIMREAARRKVKLRAELVHNGRNRMMHVTYKFAGFKEISRNGDTQLLECNLQHIQPFPGYIEVTVPE